MASWFQNYDKMMRVPYILLGAGGVCYFINFYDFFHTLNR